MRAKYVLVLLGLAITALGATWWLAHTVGGQWTEVWEHTVRVSGIGDAGLGWFVLAPLTVAVLAAPLVRLCAKLPKRLVVLGLVAAAASLVVLAVQKEWTLAPWVLTLLGLLEVVLLAGAHYVVPLLQNFPHLRRSLVVRLLEVLIVVLVFAFSHVNDVALLVGGVLAVGVAGLLRSGYRRWRRAAAASLATTQLAVLGAIPVVLVVAITCLATILVPGQLVGAIFGLGETSAHAWGAAVKILSLATLVLVCLAVLAFALGLPAWKVRRHVPVWLWVVGFVAAVAAGVLVWWFGDGYGDARWWGVPVVGLVGLAGTLLAVLGVGGRGDLDLDELAATLAARDREEGDDGSLTTALAMIIGAIPSVDSLVEATEPPFHKSVLTMTVAEDHGDTVVTFRAYGLNDESAPTQGLYDLGTNTDPDRGFFLVDSVDVHYTA